MREKVWIGLRIVLALCALGGGYLLLRKLWFLRLDQPLYLLGLLLLIPAVLLLRHYSRRQQERLDHLYEHPLQSRLSIRGPAALWKQHLPLMALFACGMVALARPQGPMIFSESTSSGIDILIGIDVSDSMKATDEAYPNRMGASANVIRQMLPFFEGDRVGLFVFSGEAFSLAPFTYDHGTLNTFLDEISPDLLPSETTDLEEAFQHAVKRFGLDKTEANKTGNTPVQEKAGQLLMLFSDGENQLGDYQDEVKTLARNKVPVLTVGVGTTQGARIPENGLMGRGYKVWQGQYAISKLNPTLLNKISDATAGTYLPLKKVNQLPAALQAARSNLYLKSSDRKTQTFEERYMYWIGLGILLWLLLPLLLSGREFVRPPSFQRALRQQKIRLNSTQVALVFFLLSPLLQSAWSPQQGWKSLMDYWQQTRGQQAYEDGNYEAAEESFAPEEDGNATLRNNQAQSQYRSEDYDQAIENFKKNLDATELNAQQKANTHYNLGNSYYRKGQDRWEDAVKAYEEALKLNPKDKQALENLNFVQQKLAEQQQKQQGNDNKNQQNQQQNQQGNNDDPQNQQQPQQNPQNDPQQEPQEPQTPQNEPTPEPSPQYYDQKELEEALKQRERDERNNKNNFHRFRKKQKEARQNQDPWDAAANGVKNW